MISNTLSYYEISESFDSNDILIMYKKRNLMQFTSFTSKFVGRNPSSINEIIDLGSKPLSAVLGPVGTPGS